MSANGAGISQIQALLGHASADTTAIYVHIALSHLKVVHAKYHPREAKKRKRSNYHYHPIDDRRKSWNEALKTATRRV
jgi:hypothetical protein